MTVTTTTMSNPRAGVVPSGVQRARRFTSRVTEARESHDGKTFGRLTGYASVTEQHYPMWDLFGDYSEVIDRNAFDKTLAGNPDVVFLLNHGGLAMARTTNGSLTLAADDEGLMVDALVNPTRSDVADMLAAIGDGVVDEMSFAFRIVDGSWSPDYSEYRILEVDLDRGDVSAVTYGANPHTSIAARSQDLMDAIDTLPEAALRAAQDRLRARLGTQPPKPRPGAQTAFLRAQLALDDDR